MNIELPVKFCRLAAYALSDWLEAAKETWDDDGSPNKDLDWNDYTIIEMVQKALREAAS